MSYDQIFNIAAAGMDLEKLRFDVAANNIANQHSLRNADGSAFIPSQVTATARPFDAVLSEHEVGGIAEVRITPENLPPNKIYHPGHPDADKMGYVSYPGISTVDEMSTLLSATRAYEADIKIMNMARSMYLQALSIGDDR